MNGMPAPMLVQLEREIDREIAADKRDLKRGLSACQGYDYEDDEDESDLSDTEDCRQYGPLPQIVTNDLKSLDEMAVKDLGVSSGQNLQHGRYDTTYNFRIILHQINNATKHVWMKKFTATDIHINTIDLEMLECKREPTDRPPPASPLRACPYHVGYISGESVNTTAVGVIVSRVAASPISRATVLRVAGIYYDPSRATGTDRVYVIHKTNNPRRAGQSRALKQAITTRYCLTKNDLFASQSVLSAFSPWDCLRFRSDLSDLMVEQYAGGQCYPIRYIGVPGELYGYFSTTPRRAPKLSALLTF
ncbi:cytoskeletal adaptor activity protein [Homalodisca vitripennis]|nr:cytoskeletal adaptor activity protein [Homalodisca vitripennis]